MIIEILILQENNAKNIVIIPNGADKDEFENNKVAKEEIFNKYSTRFFCYSNSWISYRIKGA
jgi:hypothetical protein